VHSHVGSVERMEHYVKVSKALKDQYGINLAAWIDLNFMRQSGGTEEEYLDAAGTRYKGRFLPCINDFKISDGLRYRPEELAKWQKKGIVGYKIWVGVSPLIDRPANDATFTKMEEIGMVGASVHISQPYPTKWCDDPVKFWEAHNAWERVLDRHPKLKVVNAHMLDHFNSDEQLDYLMYVLERYPNVHVDLGARFQQFNRMDRDKLRNFMIKYADRILFGTDIGGQPAEGRYRQVAESYYRAFQLLETDKVVKGGFFSGMETRGLALPADVLEKIYYRNAARLYPRVKDVLNNLGLLPATILYANEGVTLENVVSPGVNRSDEPFAEEFSMQKAVRFLDSAALTWQKQRKCFSCHSNYAFLMARPAVNHDVPAHKQIREAAEYLATHPRKTSYQSTEAVMVASVLAQNDAATTGKLHPATRLALDRIWEFQRDDGGWKWLNDNEPPSEIEEHYGVTMAAIGVGIAPDNYSQTPKAKKGLEKIRRYLQNNPPVNMHHRAMKMLASLGVDGIMTEAERREVIKDLIALQKRDGGWNLATLGANWKRDDGTPQDYETSDGYGTGFVIYALRTAGVADDDPRMWLKTHQRASGRWFTRSMRRDNLQFITHSGTAYAILALAACGEIDRSGQIK